jgi:hypothetical protein
MTITNQNGKPTAFDEDQVSDLANSDIVAGEPYFCTFTVEGVTPMLFHAWNVEAIEERANAARGAKVKKEDNVESYVYRHPETGNIALPGEYMRQSIINAAKHVQDPRSSRPKQGIDLFKAGIASMVEYADLGSKEWDYIDQRRVQVMRAGITRRRPAMSAGWRGEFTFQVLLPEYITPNMFQDVLEKAGKFVGVADFRPTYGRFQVKNFRVHV